MSVDSLTIADISLVEVKHLAAIGTLPGVELLLAAAANGPGTGYLHFDPTDGLAWQAPGEADLGAYVDVSAGDGDYLLEGDTPAKFLRIRVHATYLPAEAQSGAVRLGDLFGNAVAHADVRPAEAAAGDVTAWYLRLENHTLSDLTDLKAWLDAGTEHIEISADNATWVSPTTEGTALALADAVAGNHVKLYFQRTIPAGHGPEPRLTSLIHVRFTLGGGNYYLDARGCWRVFNAAEYRLYRSNTAPPAEGDVPWATAASLPSTPADTFADGTWYISVSYFNGVLDSGFLPIGPRGESYLRLDIAAGEVTAGPPAAPVRVELQQAAGGKTRVLAGYTEEGSLRADEWAIAYTDDGSDPAENTPDVTLPADRGGNALLDYLLPAADDGDTVKVRVQVRRNDGTALVPAWVYSEGSTVLSILADAAGPSAPLSGDVAPENVG